MADVLSEIISRLPLNALTKIKESQEIGKSGKNTTSRVENVIKEIEIMKMSECDRQLKCQISTLEAKTSENQKKVVKFKKEMNRLKELQKHNHKTQKNPVYSTTIHNLQVQLESLTKNSNCTNLTRLFDEIIELHESLQQLETKRNSSRKKLNQYEGLPSNISEARKVVSEVKERIQAKELLIEKTLLVNL